MANNTEQNKHITTSHLDATNGIIDIFIKQINRICMLHEKSFTKDVGCCSHSTTQMNLMARRHGN
jgi:hypothetical protein